MSVDQILDVSKSNTKGSTYLPDVTLIVKGRGYDALSIGHFRLYI